MSSQAAIGYEEPIRPDENSVLENREGIDIECQAAIGFEEPLHLEEISIFEKCGVIDLEKINEIIDSCNGEKNCVLSVLKKTKTEYDYLPMEALVYVANILDMPLIEIYYIATYSNEFGD